MEVDYLIIGQGICGTVLSRELLKRGKKIMVFDNFQPHTASRVASGLINPVSGKRLVKVERFETFVPYFERAYTAFEQELDTSVIAACSMLHFHESELVKNAFCEKSLKLDKYIHPVTDEEHWEHYFKFNDGISEVSPCWLIDLTTLLEQWRKKSEHDHLLINEQFQWQQCSVSGDGVKYKGIVAQMAICCEGIGGHGNPYFSDLPFTQNKGEVLVASIPGLEQKCIYKKDGLQIVPWKNDLFRIGSSFDRDFNDVNPSAPFKEKTIQILDKWLRMPYSIVDHLAAQRPTTIDRMPFAGRHSMHPAVAIFNGMGTKGCMFAPYYAHCFCEHIIDGKPLPPETDIARFKITS